MKHFGSKDTNHAKILYRRGLAHTHLMNFEQARDDLAHANKLSPNDPKIREAFNIYKKNKYECKYKTQKIGQKVLKDNNERLHAEEHKKHEDNEGNDDNGIQRGTIPYYINKSLEIWFSIPLVVYKRALYKPVSKIVGLSASVMTITDHLPFVGGLGKRGRTGTARILNSQFSKYLDRRETRIEGEFQTTIKGK